MRGMYLSNSFGPRQRRLVRSGEYKGYLTSFRDYGIPSGIKEGARWAGDNACFMAAFTEGRFVEWMEKLLPYQGNCLFIAGVDQLGDWQKTLELWRHWYPLISGLGYPVAFIGQDWMPEGEMPWLEMSVYFVGGTDEWKDSADSLRLVSLSRDRGIPVHLGRGNTHRRLSAFFKAYQRPGDPLDHLPGFTFDGNGIRFRSKADLAPAAAVLRNGRLL